MQRQKQAALAQRRSLEAGSVYIQFDFMQNLSVPQSGAEAGSWWYANCRVEYTVFGVMLRFIVDGVPRSKFVTYVSNALDHGALIASRLMQRVMTHVPHDTTKLLLWSDCGAHFRCYEFAHWALLDLPRKFRDERGVSVSVRLQFFAEKHGKGPCDGHFATMKKWIYTYCTQGHVVMTLGSVKAALDEGAAHAMRLLAPPSGPQYVNEVVDTAALEAKSPLYSEIAAYGRDPTLFRISKTLS